MREAEEIELGRDALENNNHEKVVIGSRVAAIWFGDSQWYCGTVVAGDPGNEEGELGLLLPNNAW